MKSLFLLSVSPSSGMPIYRQLMDQICGLIASGRLAKHDLLPSVRQVAQQLQINPMTVSKAYSLLERDGIIELVRGHGMRVLPRNPTASSLAQREEALRPLLRQVLTQAYQLSLSPRQVMDLLAALLKEQTRD